jgi:uncharacterized protein (DUF2267 family)
MEGVISKVWSATMSMSELAVFDTTLQKTNVWLNEIVEVLGVDRHQAWIILGAGLRAIRNRLPVELAAHLGAQLPLLVRGAYYDQFRPAEQPLSYRKLDEFLDNVAKGLNEKINSDEEDCAVAVFGVLTRHVTPEQIEKVRHALPEDVRRIWPEVMPLGHPIKPT